MDFRSTSTSTSLRAGVSPRPSEQRAPEIAIHDGFLDLDEQRALLGFLLGPGWSYGGNSDSGPLASRYLYKHFAGFVEHGHEDRDPRSIERELETNARLVADVWRKLGSGLMAGHTLTRCYANGYPSGAEGGLHLDSKVDDHFTAIYYPQLLWHPNFAGETVFFNADGSDIIASVYPKPNRLVIFPGAIPHVARAVSRTCPELRITLMFKTAASIFPGPVGV